ncbi:hypothetical protein FE257_000252 [Aspergillus nanangensis]|uniref:NmrA-like domain-containing protein n=1 Tax=Aspergillus nanangensis TaxID=2582783 RepID=A0AAD4H136_ASPNN|nr:hypothetical protein FE257_000252 [Aspergillus nanangensis]
MPSMKVAIAGGTGAVGVPTIQELLAVEYSVTVLSRTGSKSSSKLPQHTNLNVVEVDYESITSLTDALRDHTVVIACFGVAAPVGSQDALIDASIAAGVTRYFPAEFGTDTENPKCKEFPIFANKIHALDYLKQKVAVYPSFSYTALCLGSLFDWGLEVGFLIDPKKHRATIYDGGERLYSTTTLATVSKAVVSIIGHLEETKNRHVYIQDALVSQNKLIAVVQKLDGKDWECTYTTCSAAKARAYAELQKENPGIRKGLFPLLHISVLGEGYGGDFSRHLDNKLLGIKGMDDNDVENLIKKYL